MARVTIIALVALASPSAGLATLPTNASGLLGICSIIFEPCKAAFSLTSCTASKSSTTALVSDCLDNSAHCATPPVFHACKRVFSGCSSYRGDQHFERECTPETWDAHGAGVKSLHVREPGLLGAPPTHDSGLPEACKDYFNEGFLCAAIETFRNTFAQVSAGTFPTPTAAKVPVPTDATTLGRRYVTFTAGTARSVNVPQLTGAGGANHIYKQPPHTPSTFEQMAHTAVVRIALYEKPWPEKAEHAGRWKDYNGASYYADPAGSSVPRDTMDAYLGRDFDVMYRIAGMGITYPNDRSRHSDVILSQLVFSGIGQHRIEPVRADDPFKETRQGTASYAVYLNGMSALKPGVGYATLGADAYFDSQGTLLSVVRALPTGKLKEYGPDDGEGTSAICAEEKRGKVVCSDDWEDGWLHAKLAFRGSLLVQVTFADHLYHGHYVVANGLITATSATLPPYHPLRRLLTPFAWGSDEVNLNAATTLTNSLGFARRMTGLAEGALEAAFESYLDDPRFFFRTVPEQLAYQGVGVNLPYHTGAVPYYDATREYVQAYLDLYYGTDADCSADTAVQDWYTTFAAFWPGLRGSKLPILYGCATLADVLATSFFVVGPYHRHVGNIAELEHDPCFAPSAWRVGELCGTPRTALAFSTLTIGVSFETPHPTQSYEHVMLDEAAKALWRSYSAALVSLEAQTNQANRQRASKGLPVFDVFVASKIETSIAK